MRICLISKELEPMILDGKLSIYDCGIVKVAPRDWRVVDTQTGAYLAKGLRSKKECDDFMSALPEEKIQKLKAARESERGKELAEIVRKALIADMESKWKNLSISAK